MVGVPVGGEVFGAEAAQPEVTDGRNVWRIARSARSGGESVYRYSSSWERVMRAGYDNT